MSTLRGRIKIAAHSWRMNQSPIGPSLGPSHTKLCGSILSIPFHIVPIPQERWSRWSWPGELVNHHLKFDPSWKIYYHEMGDIIEIRKSTPAASYSKQISGIFVHSIEKRVIFM